MMNCPKCGGSEVRPSSRVKWIDRLRRKRALRCRTCRARFYAAGPQTEARAARHPGRSHEHGAKRGGKRRRRWIIEAVIFAVLLILFLLFLRYLTREAPPSSESGYALPSLALRRLGLRRLP